MFAILARKAIRVKTRDRRLVNEVPVGKNHDFHRLDPTPPQFAQGKIDALYDEPGILEMAVDQAYGPYAMTRKLLDDVPEGSHQRGAIEARRAGKMIAAARLLVRL